MNTLLVDSSVFLASLLESDAGHQEALNFFEHLRTKPADTFFVVPSIVALEIGNVLIRAGRETEAIHLPRYFATLQTLPIDDEFVSKALPIFPKINLKTSDAIIAASAMLWHAVLISFDKRLLREAKKVTAAMLPGEWMKA